MKLKVIVFIVLSTCCGGKAFAQTKQVTHQTLYWLRYYNQWTIKPGWVWHNEIENRRFINPHRQHHLIMHSRLHYTINKSWELGAGVTYSLQSPQNPEITNPLVVPEIRLVQVVTYSLPLTTNVALQQRLRLDERFLRKNDGTNLLQGYDFRLRLRYRLQLAYPLSSKEAHNPFTAKLSDEIMFHLIKTAITPVFDQNRLYMGIEKQWSKQLSTELGLLHWYQQNSTNNRFFERAIMRLTVYHRVF